ncbi:MAG: metal-dependent hydrolase [Minisyncoccia bacterium]
MAMFREHIAIGAIVSMIVVVVVYFYALVTDPLLLLFLFGVTIIGSFLPDVDSDSGLPFYFVFGLATLAATGVVLLYTLAQKPDDWRFLLGIPFFAMLGFWFLVGGLVRRWTHHRGIFHSLPFMTLTGVATFLIARHYGLSDDISLVFGAAIATGFASHLILDELHAGITLDGIPFNPNKAFGSAIKMFVRSNPVNIATYSLLAALVYTALA